MRSAELSGAMPEREELAARIEAALRESPVRPIKAPVLGNNQWRLIVAALRDPGEADAVRGEEAQGAPPRGPGSRPSDHAPADRDATRVDPSRGVAALRQPSGSAEEMRERCAKVCDEAKAGHISQSITYYERGLLEALRTAELRAHDAGVMANAIRDLPVVGTAWQPIETAPKDGRRVLTVTSDPAFMDHPMQVMHWDGKKWVQDDGRWFVISPNHWSPLPSPLPRTHGER